MLSVFQFRYVLILKLLLHGVKHQMIIGVTGKICSGKNCVAELFVSKGFEVWDLDCEAEKVRKDFSEEIFKAFGTVNRKELASIVFSNPMKLKMLENIIYPHLKEKIENYKKNLVINGALLQRAGFDCLCSFVVFVKSSYGIRLKRALKYRKLTKNDFIARNNAQKDVRPLKKLYTCPLFVIENNGQDIKKLKEDPDIIFSLLPKF